MKDPIGIFIATCLILVAFAVLFFASELKWRGTTAFFICLLAVLVLVRDGITDLAISVKDYGEVKVRLKRIENRLADIAEAMETLVVAQQIHSLNSDNSITLDYEPIPQSVRLIVGPITHFPRPDYGYRLEGKTIYIVHENALAQVKSRLPGGVTVEYLRKIDTKDLSK